MTKEEFDNTAFRKGDKVIYDNEIYYILGIDFEIEFIRVFNNFYQEEYLVDYKYVKYIPKLTI